MLKQMYPDFILVEQCEQQKRQLYYSFSITVLGWIILGAVLITIISCIWECLLQHRRVNTIDSRLKELELTEEIKNRIKIV